MSCSWRRRGRRRGVLAVALALLGTLATHEAGAQSLTRVSLAPSGAQWEGRLEGIFARTSALQGGIAVNVPAGRYVRIGALGAAGAAWANGEQRASARLEGVARFLLDPFRESRFGLYGVGGVSVMYDGFEHTRPNVVVGAGVEGTPRNGRAIAAELALGGGVRVAVVLRRARRTGR